MTPVIEAFATQIHNGSYFSTRINRTPLKDDFYAVGALKKGKSTNADYEDDLLLFLGVEDRFFSWHFNTFIVFSISSLLWLNTGEERG